MLPLQPFLIDLLILIVVFSAFVVGTLLWKPRIWLHDFPADIQAQAAPKTAAEKRLTTLIGVPFILLFFGLPLLLAWDLKAIMGADFSFWAAWLYAYALFIGVNLWDLIVLDWGGFALIDPQRPPFPGTEGAAGWRDYAFHFYGFLKGSVIGLVFATFVAAVITLLT
jgi:hypothetical protein